MSVTMDDPRVSAYRAALAEVNAGLSGPAGSHERYRQALTPYAEFMAEYTPDTPLARKAMMAELVRGGQLPLGIVAFAFKATEEEVSYVMDQPTILQAEPVDERERLARLPYGVYLKTDHWKRIRQAALTHAGNRCQLCNTTRALQVHHRTYERRGAERPLDVFVLCDECHKTHHGKLRAA